MFARLGNWFLSDRGKLFSGVAATGSAVTAFCLEYIPNTFLIDKYKDVVHLYKNGFTVPVSPVLKQRFNKALQLAEIPEIDLKWFKVFNVTGFDIFHAGSIHSKFGCYVGLPINFSYTDVDSIDYQSIMIMGESVAWGLDEAKSFLDSLVLSEEAQLYAIAREAKMTQSLKLLIDSMSNTISVLIAYGLGRGLNDRFNFYAKPRGLRMMLYILIGTLTYANFIFVKDFTQLYYERSVDEDLKKLNPVFVAGAKEFYSKILQRNIALRKLMGDEGSKVYSALGNENYSFRQRHLPLVQRKAFFEESVETA